MDWHYDGPEVAGPELHPVRRLSGMGAAALGAKCAVPERPVLCFSGDGGFWYHIAELETAVRYGINAVVVVNNNRSLNQEKRGTEGTYAGEPGDSDAIWHFTDVNFARVAQDIGCFGIRVEKPGDLGSALEQALASGRPAVVDVASDMEDIAAPALEGTVAANNNCATLRPMLSRQVL